MGCDSQDEPWSARLVYRLWRPSGLTFTWFSFCAAFGLAMSVLVAVEEQWSILIPLLAWTLGAAALAVSEWQVLGRIRTRTMQERVGLTPPRQDVD